MSIGSYTDLLTALKNFSHRADADDRLAEFVQLAEARINRELRTRQQLTRVSASTTASSALLALPEDFLEMRMMGVVDGGTRYNVPFETPEFLTELDQGEGGFPGHYTIIGDAIRFYPTPDAVYSVVMDYYAKVPALSTCVSGANWLLTSYPDIYLFGALQELHGYSYDRDSQLLADGRFRQAVAELKRADRNGQFSGASLTIRTL